jgi:hypothetical protein
MEKKRLEIYITLGLVVILILAVANSIRAYHKRFKKASYPSVASTTFIVSSMAVKDATSLVQVPSSKGLSDTEELGWSRDPFSGKIYFERSKSNVRLELKGILWDEKGSRALIGNEIVQEGDKVGQYTILKINKNSIIISDGTKNTELELD